MAYLCQICGTILRDLPKDGKCPVMVNHTDELYHTNTQYIWRQHNTLRYFDDDIIGYAAIYQKNQLNVREFSGAFRGFHMKFQTGYISPKIPYIVLSFDTQVKLTDFLKRCDKFKHLFTNWTTQDIEGHYRVDAEVSLLNSTTISFKDTDRNGNDYFVYQIFICAGGNAFRPRAYLPQSTIEEKYKAFHDRFDELCEEFFSFLKVLTKVK